VIASDAPTIAARVAVHVLEWLDASGDLTADADLLLIKMLPGLGDDPLPERVTISGGRVWRLGEVDGDFGLRATLVKSGSAPLVAFTTRDESSFQADLRERALLRRVIRPHARHLFAALADRESTALDDERYFGPLSRLLAGGRRDRLIDAARRRSWGASVRDADAAAIVCAAAFDFDDRYVEDGPGDLWCTWLEHPPLIDQATIAIAGELLARRYPLYRDVIATPPYDPRAAFAAAARHDTTSDPAIVRLAVDTARRLRAANSALLSTLLAPAESAYVAAGSPDGKAFVLASAYAARVRSLVKRCQAGDPPSAAEIDGLEAFAFDTPGAREALDQLARLARGLRELEAAALPETLRMFSDRWRADLAWLDRAARRVRESHPPDVEMAIVRASVVDRWYGLRDAWNEAFGRRLASEFSSLFRFPGTTAPLVVSDVLRFVVRPELGSAKTFFIVLDGCDLATFFEIAEAFAGSGVVPTQVRMAFSAIPTVTSHARRAIFGGGIPKDGLGDDHSADASGDRIAFAGDHEILGSVARRLFLKGDLGDGGAAIVSALQDPAAPPLIAAVFNDVDDAIASKEHGVLAERTLDRCTPAFRLAMLAAADAGWRIVITADHGHTPYREPDVKMALGHTRYSELEAKEAAPAGTILFEQGVGLPYRLAALAKLGAHSGPQHLGYHGGVSLEEMLVPLAIYEPGKPDGSSLHPPRWWRDVADAEADAQRAAAAAVMPVIAAIPRNVAPLTPSAPGVLARCRETLAGDARALRMLDAIVDAGALTPQQLAHRVGLPAGRIGVLVTGLRDRLEDAGLDVPLEIDDEPQAFRWRGERA